MTDYGGIRGVAACAAGQILPLPGHLPALPPADRAAEPRARQPAAGGRHQAHGLRHLPGDLTLHPPQSPSLCMCLRCPHRQQHEFRAVIDLVGRPKGRASKPAVLHGRPQVPKCECIMHACMRMVQIDFQTYRDCPVADELAFIEQCAIDIASPKFPIPVQPAHDMPELMRVIQVPSSWFHGFRCVSGNTEHALPAVPHLLAMVVRSTPQHCCRCTRASLSTCSGDTEAP